MKRERNEREAHDGLSRTAKYRLLDVAKGEIMRERRRQESAGIENERRVMKPLREPPK